MKKILIAFLTFALMLCAVGAMADELSWTEAEAMIEQGGWTGDFAEIEEVGLKMWVPEELLPVELTDEDVEEGYIAYFMTEDESAAVAVMAFDPDGMTLEDYAAELPELGATNIAQGLVNGIAAISYDLAENDAVCLAMVTDDGYLVEITTAPMSDEDFRAIAFCMVSSIQAM